MVDEITWAAAGDGTVAAEAVVLTESQLAEVFAVLDPGPDPDSETS